MTTRLDIFHMKMYQLIFQKAVMMIACLKMVVQWAC